MIRLRMAPRAAKPASHVEAAAEGESAAAVSSNRSPPQHVPTVSTPVLNPEGIPSLSLGDLHKERRRAKGLSEGQRETARVYPPPPGSRALPLGLSALPRAL
jgi:hypothetical protein